MPTSRPREVSCLGLTFIYDFMKARGVPRIRLQEGLPYPPKYLDNRLNWIDFQTMCAIEQRLEAIFPGEPDLHLQIGRTLGQSSRSFGFVRVLMRSVASPFQMYGQLTHTLPRFLFRFCHPTFELAAPGHIRARYRFEPGYGPTKPFLQTVQGILMSIPTMMGLPEASVTLRMESPQVAVYDILLQERFGPVDRLRIAARSVLGVSRMLLRNLPDAASELEETNRLLLDKVEDLTEAQDELKRRVRDLSILNSLARVSASELDLERLVTNAAAVVSDQLGEIPVAVLLCDGASGQCRVAAVTRALPNEVSELMVRVRAWVMAGVKGEGTGALRMVSLDRWTVLPLLSKERLLGVLAMDTGPSADFDAMLLGAIGDALAVAVDNALSVNVIRDLRDHLELRVQERTAELEQARGQLEDTVARLEQSDRARREFFTNVSHELKTPLTLILAPMDELEARLGAHCSSEDAASLRMVRENALSLLRLVNEILDFARLDEGRVPVNPTEIRLGAFVAEITDYLKPLADRRNVRLACSRPRREILARLDPKLLRRALGNLIVNAIKYVDPGDQVTVRLGLRRGQILIEVEDTGPGIPERERSRIFERFQRASDARGRVVEGSGIGLAMVRDIATLHGGRVELDSEEGRGSVFRLCLPGNFAGVSARPSGRGGKASADLSDVVLGLDVSPQELGAEASDGGSPGGDAGHSGLAGRILLVEDNPQMRALLLRVLSRRFQVWTCPDGVEGLELARRELPDVIVSDVMMPRMDGFEMCRRLKGDPITRGIPVILLTARHGTEAVVEGFKAGADDFVVKPFSMPELLARVDAHFRIRALTLSLVRSEQQASLGVVSAGIAHEVLNPVNAIVNSVPPLRRNVARMGRGGRHAADVAACEALLTAVEQSGERIHRIVDAFRRVTRPGEGRLDMQVARPGDVVDAVLDILQYRLHSEPNLRLHHRYDWNEHVLCHADLLGQVVMNLVGNAMDALGPTGGNVWVTTALAGDQVQIRVRDDGPGVPPKVRKGIFTPFFTTKAPGVGTGLGLAISREIMALHRGTLELVPSSGEQGAEFLASLPCVFPRDRGVSVGS